MGDIVWNLVFSATGSSCAEGGITCMGNNEMLAYYVQNTGTDPSFNDQLLFRSVDNGQNWTQISPYREPTVLSGLSDWFANPGRMLSIGTGKVIAATVDVFSENLIGSNRDGYLQPNGKPGAGAVPLTTDRGATWNNAALALGELDGDGATSVLMEGTGFVRLSDQEWWLCGFIEDFNSATIPDLGYIKTTDGGATWTFGPKISDIGFTGSGDTIADGVYLGNNRVILGGFHLTLVADAIALVAVSTDRGATWTTRNVPLAGAVNTKTTQKPVLLSGTTLLMVGCRNGTTLPGLWKSSDNGDTWSDIVASLTAVEPTVKALNDIVPLGGSRAVLCANVNAAAGKKYWYLTEDAGVSWTACTMNGAGALVNGEPQQFAVAEDGSLLCVVGDANTKMEIWRGTCSGFTPPSSPCTTVGTPCTDVKGHFLASFTFSPETLDFGIVDVGDSAALPLTVCNVGSATGTTPVVSDDPQITVDQPVVTLAPGTCTTVNVTFTPTSSGSL